MRLLPLVALCLPALFLTGCTLTPTATPSVEPGLVIHGKAIGGQQPIVGGHVYLFAANTTGYGNASVSLLSATATTHSDATGAYVLTGLDGSFDVTSDYTCTANTQVYLYSAGGNTGAGVNSAATLMAVLGNCPTSGNFATATPFVFMNEVSTVAAAYAISGFATDGLHVSSSGTALAKLGIANAFLNATNLADLAGGKALAVTPAGNGVVPQTTINTLANILATCINSTGPTSTGCSKLFANATNGGTAPIETATAAINIAHHPGTNVANLYNLPPAASPYVPSLTTQPNDFTLGLAFSGGGLNGPNYIAIDGLGNAWSTNLAGNSLSKFSSLGVAATGSPFTGNGLAGPGNHAIDDAGNVWVPNTTGTTVSKFTSSGAIAVGSPFPANSTPTAIAIDAAGSAWIANAIASGTVTKLTSNGTPAPGSPFAAGGNPSGVAIDSQGNAWIADYNAGTTVTKLTNSGTQAAGSPFGGVADEEFIVIDHADNAWISRNTGTSTTNTVAKLSNTGTPFTGSPYSGGGMTNPYNNAMDGDGNFWFANATTLGELSPAGAALSPTTAYTKSLFTNSSGLAIDGSGNLWISDNAKNTVVEVIGAAAPVVTPLATAVKNNTIASRP